MYNSLGSYSYYDGCTEGLVCSKGMFCGELTDEACRNCSFAECHNYAETAKSFSFSYTSSFKKFCRLCDKKDFDNRTQYRSWGLYKRGNIKIKKPSIKIGLNGCTIYFLQFIK